MSLGFLRPLALVLLIASSISLSSQSQQSVTDSKPSPQTHRFLSKRLFDSGDVNAPGAKILQQQLSRQLEFKSRLNFTSDQFRRMSVAPHALSFSLTSMPGIQLRDNNPAGAIPTSVVTGDFNADGHMDYIIANGYTDDLWVFFGRGDGIFDIPKVVPLTQGVSPVYLFAASLRGNGILDLVVANFDSSTIGVLLNDGTGDFGYESSYYLPEPPTAIVADDFNRDGKLDVVAVMQTAAYVSNGPYIATLYGDSTGALAPPIITYSTGFDAGPWNITSGDVNNDTFPDLFITGPGADNATIYINHGTGIFSQGQTVISNTVGTTGIVSLDGRLADMDEDACLDAVIADQNSNIRYAKGDCTGAFASPTTHRMGSENSAVRIADLNNDGHLDVVTTSIPLGIYFGASEAGDMVSVAFGDGHGNFSNGRIYRGSTSYSLSVADFNEDGKLDIVTANSETDDSTVFFNQGQGTFGFPQGINFAPDGSPALNTPLTPISFADFNNDGNMDIGFLVTAQSGFVYGIQTALNDGTGVFTTIVQTPTAQTLADSLGDFRFADFRNTGRVDFLAVGEDTGLTMGSNKIIFMPGLGNGSFGTMTSVTVDGASGEITTGDFNRDGKLDFVAASGINLNSIRVVPFLGRADGTFTKGAVLTIPFYGDVSRVYTEDLNRDGISDLLIFITANGYYTSQSALYKIIGNGDGTFQAPVQLFTPFSPFAYMDINGDGYRDLVTNEFMLLSPSSHPVITPFLAQPGGTFSPGDISSPYIGSPRSILPYRQEGEVHSSRLADLKGDGHVDFFAFQKFPSPSLNSFAQILAGNGNGTFTPTYNIYDFRKADYPQDAYDLDHDGRAELVELDDLVSSFHVIKSKPASSLQIALDTARVTGGGCGAVFPNLAPTSSTAVALSSSVPGVILPAFVVVPSGALFAQFCYTLQSPFDFHKVFDIRAQLGTDVAIAYASSKYNIGFTETLSTTMTLPVYSGNSTKPIDVTITTEPGYAAEIDLNCERLLPGVSCTFGSPHLSVPPGSSATTTLVVNTTSSVVLRDNIVVVAHDSQVAKRQPLTVEVVQLSAYVSPSLNVIPGRTADLQMTMFGIAPYNATCTGLPVEITCTVSGDQPPYPAQTTLTFTLSAPLTAVQGAYPFAIDVESGGMTLYKDVTLNVLIAPDFKITSPAITNFVLIGSTNYGGVTLTPTITFISDLQILCKADWGNSCGDLTYGTFSTIPLTFIADNSVPLGLHSFSLTATGGGITHSYTFPVYVSDFGGTVASTALTVPVLSTVSSKVTLTATQGFVGTVDIACSGAPDIECTFVPSQVQFTGTNAPHEVSFSLFSKVGARNAPPRFRDHRIFALFAMLFGPASLLVVSFRSRPRRAHYLCVSALLVATATWSACGGGSSSDPAPKPPPLPPTIHQVTVTASTNYGAIKRTVGVVTVTVPH